MEKKLKFHADVECIRCKRYHSGSCNGVEDRGRDFVNIYNMCSGFLLLGEGSMEYSRNRFDWSYKDYKLVVEKSIKDGDRFVNLDTEHCSAENEKEIVEWAIRDGFKAEILHNDEVVHIEFGDALSCMVSTEDEMIKILRNIYGGILSGEIVFSDERRKNVVLIHIKHILQKY